MTALVISLPTFSAAMSAISCRTMALTSSGRELFGLAPPSHLDQRSLGLRGMLADRKRQALALVLDDVVLKGPPNDAFHVKQRALGVRRRLRLGRGSYQSSGLREGDVTRRGPGAFAVLQDFHFLLGIIIDRDAGNVVPRSMPKDRAGVIFKGAMSCCLLSCYRPRLSRRWRVRLFCSDCRDFLSACCAVMHMVVDD